MTPEDIVIRAGLKALLGFLDGVILPSDVRQEIADLLKPLRQRDRSLAEVVRPIVETLLEEYHDREG